MKLCESCSKSVKSTLLFDGVCQECVDFFLQLKNKKSVKKPWRSSWISCETCGKSFHGKDRKENAKLCCN